MLAKKMKIGPIYHELITKFWWLTFFGSRCTIMHTRASAVDWT